MASLLSAGCLVFEHPWHHAWRIREAHFPLEITFTRPSQTAAISVTGTRCALQCPHCQGRYLKGMTPVWEAGAIQATSCLISGGCDERGRVPFKEHLESIRALGNERRLNWHVGFVDEDDVRAIAPLIDTISFDMVGDEATIGEVYGLSYSVEDYARIYRMLRQHARVIPHITIGLHGGEIRGEEHAIQLLKAAGVEALVFLVLIPTRGTPFETCAPPSPRAAAEVIARARELLPDTPVYLGCMRPGGPYRDALDVLAIHAGVNKIVNPARPAITLANQLGLRVVWENECCVLGK